jgi:antitoxin YefM
MNTISFSSARSNLKSVLDEVANDFTTTLIKRRDSEDAVVMSLDNYNSIMETLHLLSSPANAKHLADSIAQVEKGQTVTRALLDD